MFIVNESVDDAVNRVAIEMIKTRNAAFDAAIAMIEADGWKEFCDGQPIKFAIIAAIREMKTDLEKYT